MEDDPETEARWAMRYSTYLSMWLDRALFKFPMYLTQARGTYVCTSEMLAQRGAERVPADGYLRSD